MTDIIVSAILILFAVLAIRSAVKHFRGQGGCCGGSGYTPKKKRLSHVLYTKTFSVDGMHCANCKNLIEEIVNDIPGIAGRADLKRGTLTVSYAEEIDDALFLTRIERAGYRISGK